MLPKPKAERPPVSGFVEESDVEVAVALDEAFDVLKSRIFV